MADKYLSGNDFLKHLDKGGDDLRLVMLFGTEDFYIDNCIKSIKKCYIAPGGEDTDLTVIKQDSKDIFRQIADNIEMPPWFSRKRVVIVKTPSVFDAEFGDIEDKLLENIPDSCVLVLAPGKGDKGRKLTKAVVKYGTAVEVNLFSEAELVNIIHDNLKKKVIEIDKECASSLAFRCDSQLRQISSEIEKIRLYLNGKGRNKVTFDDLELICPPDLNASVFTITDSFGSGKCDGALKTLNSLLLRKEPVPKLRATLFTHLKRLIIAKDVGNNKELAALMKFSPYYAGNLVRQSSRFDMDQLINLYFAALKSESDVRHGIYEDRIALETLIVKCSMS